MLSMNHVGGKTLLVILNLAWWCSVPWNKPLSKMGILSQFFNLLQNFAITGVNQICMHNVRNFCSVRTQPFLRNSLLKFSMHDGPSFVFFCISVGWGCCHCCNIEISYHSFPDKFRLICNTVICHSTLHLKISSDGTLCYVLWSNSLKGIRNHIHCHMKSGTLGTTTGVGKACELHKLSWKTHNRVIYWSPCWW